MKQKAFKVGDRVRSIQVDKTASFVGTIIKHYLAGAWIVQDDAGFVKIRRDSELTFLKRPSQEHPTPTPPS